jgi:hypothetical protein
MAAAPMSRLRNLIDRRTNMSSLGAMSAPMSRLRNLLAICVP